MGKILYEGCSVPFCVVQAWLYTLWLTNALIPGFYISPQWRLVQSINGAIWRTPDISFLSDFTHVNLEDQYFRSRQCWDKQFQTHMKSTVGHCQSQMHSDTLSVETGFQWEGGGCKACRRSNMTELRSHADITQTVRGGSQDKVQGIKRLCSHMQFSKVMSRYVQAPAHVWCQSECHTGEFGRSV